MLRFEGWLFEWQHKRSPLILLLRAPWITLGSLEARRARPGLWMFRHVVAINRFEWMGVKWCIETYWLSQQPRPSWSDNIDARREPLYKITTGFAWLS